ncbi:ABC transporter permease subunit [Aureimonas ureilytica]|uniref:ABC transporter permease subunit n=1 Tax=Aureimonas ureilytica TaxID=401562 RepID=UPI003CF5880D
MRAQRQADVLFLSAADRRGRRAAALGALALVLLFLFAPFVFLGARSHGLVPALASLADPYLQGVIGFTLGQALLSTLLSLCFGVPFALALHRNRLPGRALLLRLLLLPQALPVLVGALGIVTIFGRNGAVADLLVWLGLPRPSIYGLPGILLAHVFFNMPLVTRMALGGLQSVPAESWKLAGQLSLSPLATFRLVEAPALRAVLPGAAALVFMLCFTSFTLVLVLGGGPAATTLQVAIYQALRYDFAPDRALALALAQVGLVTLFLLPTVLARPEAALGGFGLGAPQRRFDPPSPLRAGLDALVLAAGLVLLLAPFAAILWSGLQADLGKLLADPQVRRAALTSFGIAGGATLLGLALSLALVLSAGLSGTLRLVLRLVPALGLVVPPIVIGAGWFLVLRMTGDVARLAPLVAILANAMAILPYATRILAPEAEAAALRAGRLASSLGLSSWARLRHVELASLGRPLALSASLGLATAIGDLGSVALFGSQDFVTLPTLLLQRMGSYRSTDAEGLALLLGALCLGLILLAERGFLERRAR